MQAHRVVMACASPSLNTQMQNTFSGSILDLPISNTSIEMLLTYLYTGFLGTITTPQMALELMDMATWWDLRDLTTTCQRYLSQQGMHAEGPVSSRGHMMLPVQTPESNTRVGAGSHPVGEQHTGDVVTTAERSHTPTGTITIVPIDDEDVSTSQTSQPSSTFTSIRNVLDSAPGVDIGQVMQSEAKAANPFELASTLVGQPMFECRFCMQIFTGMQDSIKHVLTHSPDEDNATKFITSYSVEKNNKIPIQCGIDECSYVMGGNDPAVMYYHKFFQHQIKPPVWLELWDCSLCDNVSINHLGYQKHKETHSGVSTTYECKDCVNKFACMKNLIKHKLTCRKVKQFVCPKCGLRFPEADLLNIHKSMHTVQVVLKRLDNDKIKGGKLKIKGRKLKSMAGPVKKTITRAQAPIIPAEVTPGSMAPVPVGPVQIGPKRIGRERNKPVLTSGPIQVGPVPTSGPIQVGPVLTSGPIQVGLVKTSGPIQVGPVPTSSPMPTSQAIPSFVNPDVQNTDIHDLNKGLPPGHLGTAALTLQNLANHIIVSDIQNMH